MELAKKGVPLSPRFLSNLYLGISCSHELETHQRALETMKLFRHSPKRSIDGRLIEGAATVGFISCFLWGGAVQALGVWILKSQDVSKGMPVHDTATGHETLHVLGRTHP